MRRPAFAPLVQSSVPKVNHPREAAEPRGGERPVAQEIDDGARALERRVLEIDPAACIAERGVTGRLERPSDRLAQHMRERADLGDEGQPPAPDLADGAAAHQHALARFGPVHPPDLDLGVVPAAIEDVGLGDPVGGQHALGVLRIDRQVRARTHLGGRQPAFGLEVGAVEAQRPVVIGEAEGHAVRADDPPAPGERGRPLVEMGLQGRRENLHVRAASKGSPQERQEQEKRGDGEADANAVDEGLTGIGRVAADGARESEKLMHRRRPPSRGAAGRGRPR